MPGGTTTKSKKAKKRQNQQEEKRLIVEPPNKGHFGSSHTVLHTEIVLCLEAKNTTAMIGTQKCVHYWGVSLVHGCYIGDPTV